MESAPESDDKSTGIDKSEALFLCMTAAALEAGTVYLTLFFTRQTFADTGQFPSMIRLTELWNTTTGEAASTNAITKRLKGLKNKAQEILDANTNNMYDLIIYPLCLTLFSNLLQHARRFHLGQPKEDSAQDCQEGHYQECCRR
jgi:hypothetical protein